MPRSRTACTNHSLRPIRSIDRETPRRTSRAMSTSRARGVLVIGAMLTLPLAVVAQERPRPVGASLDDCTYERCIPRIQSWRDRLVVGEPERAIVLTGAAGDSLLARTRNNDLLLERRDVARSHADRRTWLGIGSFALAAVSTVVAVRQEDPRWLFLTLTAVGTGALVLASGSWSALDAEGTWNEAVWRHRDTVAGAILARRGLTVRDVASSTEALAECTWASCALRPRAGVFSDELVIGRADAVSLGFSGEGLERRVRAVPAALPAARRYASAKGIANVIGAGTLLYSLVVRPVRVWENAALIGGMGIAGWQGLRARHALEEAVWRYNRELLR